MSFFDDNGLAANASAKVIAGEPVSTGQLADAAVYNAYAAERAQHRLEGKGVNKTTDMQDLRALAEDYVDRVAKERDLPVPDVLQAKQAVATLLVDLPAKEFT